MHDALWRDRPGSARFVLRLSAALLSTVFAVSAALAAGQNVLVMVADDIGVDSLAAYGEGAACSDGGGPCQTDADCPGPSTCAADYPLTPNIDQLAATGLLFRNAWATPNCSPARATMLTGRYPFRNSVTQVGHALPPAELTIPEMLDGVYDTGAFGKWHLGGGYHGPNSHGFEHYAGPLDNLTGNLYACDGSNAPCLGDADCAFGENCSVPGIQNENYFQWVRVENGERELLAPGPSAGATELYATTVQVDDAISFITDPQRGGPWFAWMAFSAPHRPRQMPPHHLVSPQTLATLPQDADGNALPPGTYCDDDHQRACYLAMIEATDTEIGRLLDAVDTPTTVFFIADNGTPRSLTRAPFDPDHGKGTLYEGGVNVPLIVAGEGVTRPGQQEDALVHAVDLFATTLEIAGVPGPVDRVVDSVSLLPYLTAPNLELRNSYFTMVRTEKAARNGRGKLIRRETYDELYDLTGSPADPFEQNDLLLGSCSTSSTGCRLAADCAAGEACLPPTPDPMLQPFARQLDHWIEALLEDDLELPEIQPSICSTIVAGLTLAKTGVFESALSWNAALGAEGYDVVRGPLLALRASDGNFAIAADACLADDQPATSLTDADPAPDTGGAVWYLIRSVGANCVDSWNSGPLSQPTSRDEMLDGSATGCP